MFNFINLFSTSDRHKIFYNNDGSAITCKYDYDCTIPEYKNCKETCEEQCLVPAVNCLNECRDKDNDFFIGGDSEQSLCLDKCNAQNTNCTVPSCKEKCILEKMTNECKE